MNALYNLINWYTQRFRFPFHGWKYFYSFLQRTGLDKKTYFKKLHNGMRMLVSPAEHVQQQIFWYGYYEKTIALTWESLIKDNFIIFDIGANAGYYSLLAGKKLKTGDVFAFEPATICREQFQKNILLNKLKNIHLLPLAITNKTEELTFYISKQDNIGMSGLVPAENFSGIIETVHATSIDEWMKIEKIKKVDMIKIDVEGSEINVLEGMKETLGRFRPIIFIEINSTLLAKYNHIPTDIHKLLKSFGYNAYEIKKTNRLKAIADDNEGESILFLCLGYILPTKISVIA